MQLPIKGYVQIRSNGVLVAEGHNTVVTSGLELLANRIFGTEGTELPSKILFGDDGRPTTVDMTSLQGTKQAEAPAIPSITGRVLTWTSNFTYSGATSFNFRELGLFTASGVMLCRFLTSFLTQVVPGAVLEIQWQITVGD